MPQRPESPFDISFPKGPLFGSGSDPDEPASRSTLQKSLGWLGLRMLGMWEAVVVLTAVSTLLAFLARAWWPFELASHFRIQYLGILCVAIFIQYFRSKMVSGFFLLILTVVNFAQCFSLLPIGEREQSEGAANLRCMWANVNVGNQKYERLLKLIETEDPDVIVLGEVDRGWLQGIKTIEDEYQLVRAVPRDDSFGIAMYSRLPVVSHRLEKLGVSQFPAIIAELDIKGTKVSIVGAHVFPPVGANGMSSRNAQLIDLAKVCDSIAGHQVLVGDFNITSWSPYFQDFETNSGLKDSRVGIGIQPTWHTGLWFACIPIDHCLVSPDVSVLDRRVTQKIGSDHLPIVIDLQVPGL